MKYCTACGRITPGDPLFCQSCGCSYDVKLCPRLHPNSRHAEVCSRCGSRDFSTPQPIMPFGRRVLWFLQRAALVLCLTVLVLAFVATLLGTREGQNAVVALGLMGALLWWLWSLIPEWLRKRIHRNRQRKGHGSQE